MYPPKMTAFVLLAAFSVGVCAAQQRSVEVVGLEDHDLRRTAHHMGTSVQHVREARELLEKAGDLAFESDLDSSWPSLLQFAWLWRRTHPRKAVSVVEKMLDKLKATARQTDNPATYGWCVSEAHALLGQFLGDADRLEAFLEQWPKREDLGDTSNPQLDALTEQVHRQRVLNAADRDPKAAAQLLRSGLAEASSDLLTEVAARLESEGQREAARRLLAERIAELAGAPDSPDNTRRFLELLHTFANEYPELVVPALRVFNSREWSMPPDFSRLGLRLENDLGEAQLTPSETAQYFLLRNLVNHPETLLAALENMPSLKAKLDRLGGFDQAGQAELTAPDGAGNMRSFNMREARRGYQQFRYRWGEANTRPSAVRKRLEEAFPDGLNWPLLGAVQSRCGEDPAFSKLGLEVLRERFFAEKDPDFSRLWLPQLLQAHSHCEGQADRSLIEFGFQLLEESGTEPEPAAPTRGRLQTGQNLEHRLLVEWSRLDFDAASEHVRQLENPAEKFRVYLAMAESRAGR